MMTETPWTNGYGDGVSGPTTPATDGVTVHESLQMDKFQKSGKSEDYPYGYYTVISKGLKTIAIIPTLPDSKEEGEANAKRIVDCVNAMEGIDDPISFMKSLRFMASNFMKEYPVVQ